MILHYLDRSNFTILQTIYGGADRWRLAIKHIR